MIHDRFLVAQQRLAELYIMQSRYSEAEALLKQVIDAHVEEGTADSDPSAPHFIPYKVRIAQTRLDLGKLYATTGRFASINMPMQKQHYLKPWQSERRSMRRTIKTSHQA